LNSKNYILKDVPFTHQVKEFFIYLCLQDFEDRMDPAKMYNSIPNTLHDIARSYRYIYYFELFEIIGWL